MYQARKNSQSCSSCCDPIKNYRETAALLVNGSRENQETDAVMVYDSR